MDAADLQGQFRLGECLLEPGIARITGPSGAFVLQPEQLAVLMCLVRHHGEAVSRAQLRQCAWPQGGGTDHSLRTAVRALREMLGGSVRDRRYIVSVGRGDFALVARCERLPAGHDPSAEIPPLVPAPVRSGPIGKMQLFVGEVRRRSVLKVAGSYFVAMLVMLQGADVVFEPLLLPEWWLRAMVIVALVSLPIVAVLAWAYEITPGGIVLDDVLTGRIHLPRARRAVAPALLVTVTLMLLTIGLVWFRSIDERAAQRAGPPALEPSAQSIAVLSFADMSPDSTAGYLGDGLSEELASDLAKLPGLRIAARTSSFAFKGRDMDVRSIASQLGVRFVLEGSVRREGDRVRVTAQLIDAATGYHAWTESYDRPWRDLIGIQQDIAGAIARKLQVVLTPELAQQMQVRSTKDPRAYDYYLAGLAQLRQGGSLTRIGEAEAWFERALSADPGFGRAQAGLCRVSILRYERTNATDHVHEAEAACRAALDADATLKETELALGWLYLTSGRHEQAEAIYRSLLRRSPRDAEAHMGLGWALSRANRAEEAELSFRQAMVVEPGYWKTYNALGSYLFSIGRSDEAAEAYAHVTELAPGNPTGFNNLGAARLAAGQLDAAAKAFEKSNRLEPSRSAYANLGTVYYYLGRLDEAEVMYSKALELAGEDFRLWLGRGDVRWYLPQRHILAMQDYRRAAALGEKALAVDAADAETWAILGLVYGRLDDPERAGRYVQRALEMQPDSPFVNQLAAIAAADSGDRQGAGRLASRAVELGHSRQLVEADPALKGIAINGVTNEG